MDCQVVFRNCSPCLYKLSGQYSPLNITGKAKLLLRDMCKTFQSSDKPKTLKLLISAGSSTELHVATKNTKVCVDLFAKSSSDSVYNNLTLPLGRVHNKNKTTLNILVCAA